MDISGGKAAGARPGYITRERAGVALLFLMNGFLVGAWAPKIPEFAERLGLTESMLGVMILVFGLGSLVMMPIAGSQIGRFGSSTVSRATALLAVPTLLLLTWVDGLWSGAFPLPAAMGGGRSSMHAYFHRYDRYADLPESIRSFVEEYATMWREPPCDLDEIRELQK